MAAIKYTDELRINIENAIARHRYWYVFQGIVFVVAGLLAVILPNVTAIGFSILIAILLIVSGIVQAFATLPGDIIIKRKNFTFYFPITTSIILSLLLTGILFLFHK